MGHLTRARRRTPRDTGITNGAGRRVTEPRSSPRSGSRSHGEGGRRTGTWESEVGEMPSADLFLSPAAESRMP